MTILLLAIIYIAYISLGIPDSILGAAWPAIYREFELPVSYASYITVFVSLGTIISSFFSARIINRLGTVKITILSTILTSAALLGFSFSQDMVWFCLLAFPLGLGAGSIDTALNNYIALHYKANHMNFLHCFYGIGVALSPYLMSLSLKDNANWRMGYRIMFLFQISIALLMVISIPVWKKVGEKSNEDVTPKTLTTKQILKLKGTKAAFGVFIFSCGIEAVCTVWGSTFFVEAKGTTPDNGAKLVVLYFVGLTLGRFISGILSNKLKPFTLIVSGVCIVFVAIGVTIFTSSSLFSAICLFLIGFGIGPVFPNMTHLTPLIFGKEVSQSIIGLQMALAYVSVMATPLVFGQVAQHFGVKFMPLFLLALFLILSVSIIFLRKVINSSKNNIGRCL